MFKLKKLKIFFFTIFLLLQSCGIYVQTDYDRDVDFSEYNTFAFYKPDIDKVKISDLDKKRMLKYIDLSLKEKGLTRSDNPDIIVTIETLSRERVYLRNNLAYGYYPQVLWGYYNHPSSSLVTSNTQGTLFINIIDTKNNQLVWQGRGVGIINEFREDRDEMISNFVNKIFEEYPPKSD
jgi:hypothetical protein|tara:strand:- start:185 stop:721 length:537 start_codon:yes stop_codon:yes gene_type:complete